MISAKEKARELVDKFINYSYFSDGNNSMNRSYQQEDNAIQCALIAVDELIKETGAKYWYDVKQEIEKL